MQGTVHQWSQLVRDVVQKVYHFLAGDGHLLAIASMVHRQPRQDETLRILFSQALDSWYMMVQSQLLLPMAHLPWRRFGLSPWSVNNKIMLLKCQRNRDFAVTMTYLLQLSGPVDGQSVALTSWFHVRKKSYSLVKHINVGANPALQPRRECRRSPC